MNYSRGFIPVSRGSRSPERTATLLIGLLLFTFAAPLAAAPAAWGLDPTFGENGIVTTNISRQDISTELAIQPDGKIVVVGYATSSTTIGNNFFVTRYTVNGALDTTFANSGYVAMNFGYRDADARTVAFQADGKIVVGGLAMTSGFGRDFGLARFNNDGSLDASFGGDGLVVTRFSDNYAQAYEEVVESLVIQPDGKVVAAGTLRDPSQSRYILSNRIALARYNADGSLDSDFGTNGLVESNFGNELNAAMIVAQQSDGKFVIGGYTGFVSEDYQTRRDFMVARYNTDGTLDTTFGQEGKTTTDFEGKDDVVTAMVLRPDDSILVVGYSSTADSMRRSVIALAQFEANGAPDFSFQEDGKATYNLPAGDDVSITDIALQSDGAFLISGYTFTPNRSILQRYLPDGSIDSTFGSGGTLFLDTDGYVASAQAIALQQDGKVVVAGDRTTEQGGGNPPSDIVVRRFQADAPFLPPAYDYGLWLPLVKHD